MAGPDTASALSADDTGTVGRGELNAPRNRTMLWWAVGLAAGIVVLIAIWIAAARSDAAARSCKGGPNQLDVIGTSFNSNDGVHWTATYPCTDGGFTTVPIARRDVPGAGS